MHKCRTVVSTMVEVPDSAVIVRRRSVTLERAQTVPVLRRRVVHVQVTLVVDAHRQAERIEALMSGQHEATDPLPFQLMHVQVLHGRYAAHPAVANLVMWDLERASCKQIMRVDEIKKSFFFGRYQVRDKLAKLTHALYHSRR